MSLVVSAIHKTYPNGIKALKGVDLSIEPGEVFGLVGPNGAGKSTLLKVISGLLRAESGAIRYNAEDITGQPARAARFIGLMPDPLGVYTDITTWDYLEFFGRVLGLTEEERKTRIADVVQELELGAWLNEEVETLSAGWQRRAALGRILLAKTPVLLLDEPAAGLDISARKELLDIVRRLASQDRSIVVSSHILPELQDLADRFGILDDGEWKNVTEGQPFFQRADLDRGLATPFAEIKCSDPAAACRALSPDHQAEESAPGVIRILTPQGKDSVAAAVRDLCGQGIDVYEVRPARRDLGDVVLQVLDDNEGGDRK